MCSFCCLLNDLSVRFSVCVLFLLFIDWSECCILCLCVVFVVIDWSECSILCCVLFLLFIDWSECSNLCLCVVSVVY